MYLFDQIKNSSHTLKTDMRIRVSLKLNGGNRHRSSSSSSSLCHRLQRKRFPRNKNIQFRILFSTNEEVMNEGRKDR